MFLRKLYKILQASLTVTYFTFIYILEYFEIKEIVCSICFKIPFKNNLNCNALHLISIIYSLKCLKWYFFCYSKFQPAKM